MESKIIATDGYRAIVEIDPDNDRIKTDDSNRWKSLFYTVNGRIYFTIKGRRYYLDEFMIVTRS